MSWSDADYKALTEIKEAIEMIRPPQAFATPPGWYMIWLSAWIEDGEYLDPRLDGKVRRKIKTLNERLPLLGICRTLSGAWDPVMPDGTGDIYNSADYDYSNTWGHVGPYHDEVYPPDEKFIAEKLAGMTNAVLSRGQREFMKALGIGLYARAGQDLTERKLVRTITHAGFDTESVRWACIPYDELSYIDNGDPLVFAQDGQMHGLHLPDASLDRYMEFSRTIIPDKKRAKRTKKAGRSAR